MQLRRIARSADDALLVELDGSARGLRRAAEISRSVDGVRAAVVGQASLFLMFEAGADWQLVAHDLERRLAAAREEEEPTGRVHRLRVSIHPDCGPDIPLLLERTGLSRESFRDALRGLSLVARYLGFRAGFAYLDGLPEEWLLPRRAETRSRVHAGSFAIAGNAAGFYPVDSPGGWNLLGRTDAILWDPRRDPPNLIEPGDTIRIEPVDEPLEPPPAPGRTQRSCREDMTVVESGLYSAVTGGPDWSRLRHGLAPGGWFDRTAASAANLAVGNPADALLLECAGLGPALRFHRSATLSWSGAVAELSMNSMAVREVTQFGAGPGDVLRVGRIHHGMRGYLAVRGGFVAEGDELEVVPRRLEAGNALECGVARGTGTRIRPFHREERLTIRVAAGPHKSSPAALAWIEQQEWTVSPNSDRVAVRLRAAASLPAEPPADLPSCGMQFGTIQWHPSGELVALGPDHPVTGGYLQAMTVLSADRWKLAQLMPGERIRFQLAAMKFEGVDPGERH